MNEEIKDRLKFKLWDKKEKTMCPIEIDYIDKELLSNKNYKILQSTGLRDKNNELIHEGDIVEFIDFIKEERKGVIIFDDRCASFFVEKIIKLHRLTEFVNVNRYDLKILGNIYENPELLESEE